MNGPKRSSLNIAFVSLLLWTAACTQSSHPQEPFLAYTTQEGFLTWESPVPVLAHVCYRRTPAGPDSHVYECAREYRSNHAFPLPPHLSGGDHIGWIKGVDRRGRLIASDSLSFSSGGHWTGASLLEMTTFDVGWGDSHLLVLPGGSMVLIDCGSLKHLHDLTGHLEERLSAAGRSRIDVLVLTHAHGDHIGGAIGDPDRDRDGIIERFSPSVLILPDTRPDSAFSSIIACAESRDIDVYYPEVGEDDMSSREALGWDPAVRVEVLSSGWPDDPGQVNNTSLVFRVSFGEMDILFTGDAEQPAEHRMLCAAVGSGKLGSEVLKVSHHGSSDANSPAFLRAVLPRVSILSIDSREVGWALPDEEVLSALDYIGSEVFRTDGLHPGGSGSGSDITLLSDGRYFDVGPR